MESHDGMPLAIQVITTSNDPPYRNVESISALVVALSIYLDLLHRQFHLFYPALLCLHVAALARR